MSVGPATMGLRSGETILWTGRPIPRCWVLKDWWQRLPLGLFWLAFSVLWTGLGLAARNIPWFVPLWGLPFIGIGLYLSIGRLWWRYLVAQSTTYTVTDQRVVIRCATLGRVREWQYENRLLPHLGISAHGDGTGDIFLDEQLRSSLWSHQLRWRSRWLWWDESFRVLRTALWCIPDASNVYGLVAGAPDDV